ncbi:MAG: hypothetical protein U0531_07470 [Dehalococcoidia bacterium]
MITMRSFVHVNGIRGEDVITFLLNCTDRLYRRWWPGTHLRLHTIKRARGNVGSLIVMDEYVGRRRLTMQGVVTELVPGRRLVLQWKQIVRLPAWLELDFADDDRGVTVTHTVRAGLPGAGAVLDPLIRLYLSDAFARALDEHVKVEMPRLGVLLSGGRAPQPTPS